MARGTAVKLASMKQQFGLIINYPLGKMAHRWVLRVRVLRSDEISSSADAFVLRAYERRAHT